MPHVILVTIDCNEGVLSLRPGKWQAFRCFRIEHEQGSVSIDHVDGNDAAKLAVLREGIGALAEDEAESDADMEAESEAAMDALMDADMDADAEAFVEAEAVGHEMALPVACEEDARMLADLEAESREDDVSSEPGVGIHGCRLILMDVDSF